MELFNKIGKLLYVDGTHYVYSLNWPTIAKFCKKWSRNREPDMKRVTEMIAYHKKGGYIPRHIHLAHILEEGLVCYDGNHRREVFEKIGDVTCIVDVMFNATQESVYKAFDDINKSIQVSAIHLIIDETVKTDIENLVYHYTVTYPTYVSTSARCLAPNFNRDRLSENLYDVYQSFDGRVSIEEIACMLDVLNNANKSGLFNPHDKYNRKVLNKCEKGGLWLFLEKTISPIDLRDLYGHPDFPGRNGVV